MTKEIETLDDVKNLVNHFYDRVQKDDLLGPIFNPILKGRWPEHLQKMYNFWQTVLLAEHTYRGYPFKPHAGLPVDQHHFERWLQLFFYTLDTEFEGDKVMIAKRQANIMAQMFHMRIQYARENDISLS